ncbi:MAG: hypothetical protein P4L22_05165 [Candidatus Babeliales bacterium]|nr:hypothetical protein [Candidatus Babeliales bacterium]
MKNKLLLILCFLSTNCYTSEKPSASLSTEHFVLVLEEMAKGLKQTYEVIFHINLLELKFQEYSEIRLIEVLVDAMCLILPEGNNEFDLFIEAFKGSELKAPTNQKELEKYLKDKRYNLNKFIISIITSINIQQNLTPEANKFFNSLFESIQEVDYEGQENYKSFIKSKNELETIFRLMLFKLEKETYSTPSLTFEERLKLFQPPSQVGYNYQDDLIKDCISKCKKYPFPGTVFFYCLLKAIHDFKILKIT